MTQNYPSLCRLKASMLFSQLIVPDMAKEDLKCNTSVFSRNKMVVCHICKILQHIHTTQYCRNSACRFFRNTRKYAKENYEFLSPAEKFRLEREGVKCPTGCMAFLYLGGNCPKWPYVVLSQPKWFHLSCIEAKGENRILNNLF
jgi:hypothetical protein